MRAPVRTYVTMIIVGFAVCTHHAVHGQAVDTAQTSKAFSVFDAWREASIDITPRKKQPGCSCAKGVMAPFARLHP